MGINKVVYGTDTLIDISEDTVTEEDVVYGVSFHNAEGIQQEGTITNYRDAVVDCIGGIDEKNSQIVMVIENEWGILDFLNAVVNLSTRFVCRLTDIIPKLGNAKPSDVKKGVIFSSNQGFKLVGTHEEVAPESKFASGTFTAITSNVAAVDCGFRPRYISITQYATPIICEYNSDYDATKQRIVDANGTPATVDAPSTRNLTISAITDTGFSYRGYNTSRQYYWFAVG